MRLHHPARPAVEDAGGVEEIGNAPPIGLTSEQAARRLAEEGPNEPGAAAKEFRAARQVLAAFANPLVLLLLAASIVSGALGQVVNAVLIACMVLLSVTLNLVQTFRSQRAVRAAAPAGGADGDGAARRRLDPDSAARARRRATGCGWRPAISCPRTRSLLEAKDLHVQQAALTGESLPAEKQRRRKRGGAADLPRHVDRQRHGGGARDGDRGRDALRRHRRPPRRPAARDGVRARDAPLRLPDHADGRSS